MILVIDAAWLLVQLYGAYSTSVRLYLCFHSPVVCTSDLFAIQLAFTMYMYRQSASICDC